MSKTVGQTVYEAGGGTRWHELSNHEKDRWEIIGKAGMAYARLDTIDERALALR